MDILKALKRQTKPASTADRYNTPSKMSAQEFVKVPETIQIKAATASHRKQSQS
jgi:hypothetical protein